jgi:hypothetical protein
LPYTLPTWFENPAITRIGITSPAMLEVFRKLNARKTYGDQIKPFSFLLSCQVARLSHPTSVEPERFHLIRPYTANPREAMRGSRYDLHDTGAWHITTTQATNTDERIVRVKTIRDVFSEHTTHPELKSLDSNGTPCAEDTTGLLRRRPVTIEPHSIRYIGKESNRLHDLETGLVCDERELIASYQHPRTERAEWRAVWVPQLRNISRDHLILATNLSERALRDILADRAYPHRRNREALRRASAVSEPRHAG